MEKIAEIKGTDGRLAIRVVGYERPSPPTNLTDRNWLLCHYELSVRNFSCGGGLRVLRSELDLLNASLSSALELVSGIIQFKPLEPTLQFQIEFERTGTAGVTGIAQELGKRACVLSFRFSTDQTYLGQFLKELKTILTEFPQR